jgi:hypothetical protein
VKKNNSNQFCQDIFGLDLPFGKVLINLLMSLSSSDSRSVVGLSESPLFEHSYSSISQSASGLSVDRSDYVSVLKRLQSVWMSYYDRPTGHYSLQTDTSPMIKPFSKKLGERQYVNVPNNVVPGNKSLNLGYNYSYVNLGYTPPQGGSRWSLPLDVERVRLDCDAINTALVQHARLMTDDSLPFGQADLVLNSSDSGYFTPRYLAELVEKYPNMVQICRMRHGSKVWQQAAASPREAGQKGATSVYGTTTYYLIAHSDVKKTTNGKTKVESSKARTAIYDLPPTETVEIETITSRGRALIVKIERWDNIMIRSKAGHSMKDKPFNLFASQVIDAQTGELVFQKPMFITVFGQLKDQVSTVQAHQEYRNRYDIEGHNRFSSHNLLVNDYQTPEVQTLDNWLLIVAIAYWLLFVAADEVELVVKPWERNLPKNKEIRDAQTANTQPKKSVAQTKKGTYALFSTFDRKPYQPKSVNNGKGRKEGTKLSQKKDKKVNRKANKSNVYNKTQKNE